MTRTSKYFDTPWIEEDKMREYKKFRNNYSYQLFIELIDARWVRRNKLTSTYFRGRIIVEASKWLFVLIEGDIDESYIYK